MEKNLKKEKKYVCKKQKTKSLCCLPETMWINYTSFKKEKDKVKHNKISKADNYYWATKNEGIKLLKKKKKDVFMENIIPQICSFFPTLGFPFLGCWWVVRKFLSSS